MMTGYAEVRGLRRWLLPVPVLTPRLSSYWVHLVTPIRAEIAQPLIEGLRNEVVVRDQSARQLFPEVALQDYQRAVKQALQEIERPELLPEGRPPSPERDAQVLWERGLILERRSAPIESSATSAFQAFGSLGGPAGWLALNWAWRLRGALDRMVGGVGMRPQRRLERELRAGDTVDFWTVDKLQPDRRLRLRADLRLPGQAWLEFAVRELPSGVRLLIQTAIYAPKGLLGVLYWMLLYPAHRLIFGRLHRRLIERARQIEAASRPPSPRAT